MHSTSHVPPDAAARKSARREWGINLSAILFVVGMGGLCLASIQHQIEQDRWQRMMIAEFNERMPKAPVVNFHHVDNSKYLAEAAGCLFVLALAAVVRAYAPRPARRVKRIRLAEKWASTPARREQRKAAEPAAPKRRKRATRPDAPPELADRLAVVVWGDRVARKETASGAD